MPDRSHLTPVRTVDSRGWATTVYRRLAARSAAGTRSIPPQPALSPAAANGAARLPGPPPRSRSEIAALGRKLADKETRRAYRRMTSTPEGRAAAELALETIDSSRLSGRITLETVAATCAVGAGLLTDSLRIAPPVLDDIERRRGPGGGGWRRQSFNRRLQAIINGQRRRDPRGPAKVTDEKSLAAAVAVACFIDRIAMLGASAHAATLNSVHLASGVDTTCIYLREPELERTIRDHPDQLDRIIEHSHTRDLSRPENVRALRAVLDGDVAAPLADGLL